MEATWPSSGSAKRYIDILLTNPLQAALVFETHFLQLKTPNLLNKVPRDVQVVYFLLPPCAAEVCIHLAVVYHCSKRKCEIEVNTVI